MSVLGELVVPNGGAAWTQTLVAVLASLGIQEKAARQTIARMHERQWLDKDKVGRQTRWQLTNSSVGLLEAGAARIYGFGQTQRPWDETWLVLMASVPESERNIRYRMGVGLSWVGFGSLGQGTWLSPWVEHEAVAVSVVSELGIDATSFRAQLGELGSGERLVDQAWDVDELRDRYVGFLDETEALVGAAPDGVAAVADLVGLVHRWRRFPFLDPDLPAALLPADWPGPVAAARFNDLRAELLPAAMKWWAETEATYSPG